MIKNISVIIPAYNESSRIGRILTEAGAYLKKSDFDYEILVVIDGESSETLKVINELNNSNIRAIINNTDRSGKGNAVKRGVIEARKEWILMMDADMATPIEELNKFEPFTKNFDLIIGNRLEAKNSPLHRKISGRIFNLWVRLFLLPEISDTQCGFKLFKAEAGKKIFILQKIKGFAFDAEMLFIAKKLGFKIKEVPVQFNHDPNSKVNIFKDAPLMLKDLFRIIFNDLFGKYDPKKEQIT